MPQSPLQVIITIIIISLATFTTRLIPFILFPENKQMPKYIDSLSRVLPYAIIGMLIVYCLKDVQLSSSPFGIPELVSILFITIIHLWKKNMLVSIGGGTLLYMFLVQVVFL